VDERAGSRSIGGDYAAVSTIRQGKIVRVVWFEMRAEALTAVSE
jgi:hypothetical protein